jgi:hypothetical protein
MDQKGVDPALLDLPGLGCPCLKSGHLPPEATTPDIVPTEACFVLRVVNGFDVDKSAEPTTASGSVLF